MNRDRGQSSALQGPGPLQARAQRGRASSMPGIALQPHPAQQRPRYQIGFIANPSSHGMSYRPPQVSQTLSSLQSPQARNAVGRQVGYGSNNFMRMVSQYASGAAYNPYYAVSRVFGGHTSLHSQVDQGNRSFGHMSVGFNPRDMLSGVRISMGVKAVPGGWHNDTGMHADPTALQATVRVGAGVHSAFRGMQQGMQQTNERERYSWSPNATDPNVAPQNRLHNCVTMGSKVVKEFARSAYHYTGAIGELQGHFARDNVRPSDIRNAVRTEDRHGRVPMRLYSENQMRDRESLRNLHSMGREMHGIAEQARVDHSGNQKRVVSSLMSGHIQAKL